MLDTTPRPVLLALAANALLPMLSSGDTLTRAQINETMRAAFGASDADGAWTQRDSFEAVEAAMALFIADLPACIGSNREELLGMSELAARLPTQTVRSETQQSFQQFSTPLDLAWFVAWLGCPAATDTMLEPSAGTGLLAAHALRAGCQVHLNELGAARAGLLKAIWPHAHVTRHDAAKINTLLDPTFIPDLIIMNPPFSKSAGRDDHHAATRHLQSALRRLRRGGRLVAILPDWFYPSAEFAPVLRDLLTGSTLKLSLRLDRGGYAKHGTSVAIRIYVIDKIAGQTNTVTIQRASVLELFDAVGEAPARASVEPDASDHAAGKPASRISLFRSMRSITPTRNKIVRSPQVNEVLPVQYTVLDEPASLAEQQGIYVPYRPSRMSFTHAGEHPTLLVESVAMGSIAAPKPQSIPRLPELTVKNRILSSAQLETLVYTGDAWDRWLPGRFLVDPQSINLNQTEQGHKYRYGFFLGDGTGAGKGRQVAACILEQWLKGRRRHIWISKNETLLEDAQRDWMALGGLPADIMPINSWKIDQTIGALEGILFVPYGTLRSQRLEETRLRQILAWAGDDFEGVIAFDESHEMGGVAGGEGAMGPREGSLQGIAGVMLQNHLPAARVLYASATGASEINNLAYAVRLGLWGPGTSFATREAFITDIRNGGIAAMELVARDLKATGLYTARALSFAGVEYEILEHKLTADQIEVYDQYADAWAIIHQNMERALELTGVVDALENTTLNSQAKASARSRFESTKQRFFNQLLLSMKLPSLFPAMVSHLDDGQSVVVQLVTTAESILNRRLGALSPEDRADLDIDLSPREYVIDYLVRAFPTRQMQEFTDDNGNLRSFPMDDAAGNPVYNPEAEAARDVLIELLCAYPPIHSALDAIILRFGVDQVAEVTGRTKRLITGDDGSRRLESRSSRVNIAETQDFMAGRKRIIVFSDAGGTGRSYHASLDAQNQQRRVHFLLELGWRADRAIQGLGRTNRTYQASSPLFRPVTTDCRGELRFTSTIARRLDSLGALTRGQRQTGGQNLFDPSDNLESDYAKAALVEWYHLLVGGKLTSTSLADFEKASGLSLTDNDGILVEDLPPIQRWLNRLLAMRIATQNAIFDEFIALVERRVAVAKQKGTFDLGVETSLVETATVLSDRIIRQDPISGATSHLLTLEVANRRRVRTLTDALGEAESDPRAIFMKNVRSGKVALRLQAHAHMDEQGKFMINFELFRPLRSEYIYETQLAESNWEEIPKERFEELWTTEYDADFGTLVTQTVHLATGLLLPIWSTLPKESLSVTRIVDQKGDSWLGRIVPEIFIERTLRNLGITDTGPVDHDALAEAIIAGKPYQVCHPHNFLIKSSRVNGARRIEVVEPPAAIIPELKAKGCFTEIIQYKTRVFVPLDRARAIIPDII